jgi:hypothetical protein
MTRLRTVSLVLAAWLVTALGAYELTAKSPRLLGAPLPGWWASQRAERSVRWTRPTGLLPVDKLVHESHEAALFYALLSRPRPEPASR